MAVDHFVLAICIYYEQNFAAVMLMVLFILFFQLSEGPTLWIYSAEICHDSAFGIVTLGKFLNMFIVSIASEYIIAGIGPHGTFFFFGSMSFVGGLFIYFFVKETKGLNDWQKK